MNPNNPLDVEKIKALQQAGDAQKTVVVKTENGEREGRIVEMKFQEGDDALTIRMMDGAGDTFLARSDEVVEIKREAMEPDCYIWSNTHGAWWRPESAGYTINIEEAGIYKLSEAIYTCATARDGIRSTSTPTEMVVRKLDLDLAFQYYDQQLAKSEPSTVN